MKERKQSFLERLTGTRMIEEDEGGSYSSPNEPVRIADRRQPDPEPVSVIPDEEFYEEEAGLAVDMYETDNEIVIQSMIAGVTPENLHIAITRDSVTLRGKRIPPSGIPGESYIEQELYWGPFSREIALPFEIDTDGAEAIEKYGLLIIRLPKLDTSRMQELKVRSV